MLKLALLSCFIQRVWALSLSWPADGAIISHTSILIGFGGGLSPYTVTVLRFNGSDAGIPLQTFAGLTGDSIEWDVSVPGGFVRFSCTDTRGTIVTSDWQTVYPDPMVSVSTLSVASVHSVVSVQSGQSLISQSSVAAALSALSVSASLSQLSVSASISQLSVSAIVSQLSVSATAVPTRTITPAPSTPTAASGNSSPQGIKTTSLLGGVLGGVAGLLIVAILAFWRMNRMRMNANRDTQILLERQQMAEENKAPHVHVHIRENNAN